MRKLNILKTLIDIFFFFAVLAMISMIVVVPIIFANPDGIDLKIQGQEINTFDLGTKILIVFGAAGAACFVYAIYILRKTIGYFTRTEIFHPDVIFNLHRIGIFIIASSLLTNIPLYIYNLYKTQKVGLEFGVSGFDSLILSVCLGLFFMVLSEVFKIALRMKEENELTV